MSFSSVLSTADDGPLVQAELYPLISTVGRLRVTYNWQYSALNCDPNDDSTFVWTISKLDATHVALSPRDGYAGMTVYASVRDDWSWFVQVQAPNSADWITAVGGDETIAMSGQGLNIVSLAGFNDEDIAVNADPTSDDDHTGYRLQSVGSADPHASMWFLGIVGTLQDGLPFRLKRDLTDADIGSSFAESGLSATDEDIARIRHLLSQD